jgi:hypothetical protein
LDGLGTRIVTNTAFATHALVNNGDGYGICEAANDNQQQHVWRMVG